MNIQVTVETFRETCQESLVVRRGMAFRTLGHILVLAMVACGTVDLGMLARGLLPLFKNLFVA